MNGTDDIQLDRRQDGIALVTLNRPERLNALSQMTVRRLCASLDALATDDAVRVVVITGAGRGFCAGWDLASPLTDATGADARARPRWPTTASARNCSRAWCAGCDRWARW